MRQQLKRLEISTIPKDELLGTWLFNDSITIPSNIFHVTYSNEETDYYYFTYQSNRLYFATNLTGDESLVYMSTRWIDEKYKTITITDTSSLTNRDEFTTWLKANATKQS